MLNWKSGPAPASDTHPQIPPSSPAIRRQDPECNPLWSRRGERNAPTWTCVVEAAPFGPGRSRHQVMNRLYRAVAGLGVPADILAYSLDDVEYWRDSLNHVPRALREGRVLYERS